LWLNPRLELQLRHCGKARGWQTRATSRPGGLLRGADHTPRDHDRDLVFILDLPDGKPLTPEHISSLLYVRRKKSAQFM